MKQILILLFFILSAEAVDLEEIITTALEKNHSLDSINERILASKEEVRIADRFSNPELVILTNTIDDKEPMAQQSITLKQKLPYFGKQESAKQFALAHKSVLEESLQSAQTKLVYLIRSQAYSIWELERSYKIICDYEELTKHNIELFESYATTSDNQHMGIMSAELALSDLRIQKSLLFSKINAAYAQLSYLSAQEVDDLLLVLDVGEMPGQSELDSRLAFNKELLLKEKEVERERRRAKMIDLNNYPDLVVVAGYSYRENFDNYATVGLGLSLPIYGSEDHQAEEARRKALSVEALQEDTRQAVQAEFQSAYAQMKSAYETYHIINDQSLPQVEHMFELINASVSAGGDLFKYIDILVQKLRLEQKSINAVANYNRANARIRALSGETE